jgi:hypothetical protein
MVTRVRLRRHVDNKMVVHAMVTVCVGDIPAGRRIFLADSVKVGNDG